MSAGNLFLARVAPLKEPVITMGVLVALIASVWANEVHDAVRSGDRKKVEEILQQHPEWLNATNSAGYTPLQVEALRVPYMGDGLPYLAGDRGIAELLIGHGAEVDIFSAASLGKADRVSALLDGRPDLVGAHNRDGTPLHWAARNNRVEVAAILLKRGAELEAREGPAGLTPLMEAANLGNKQVIEALLAKGADVNAADRSNHRAALFWAMMNQKWDVMATLLAHGANVNWRDAYGTTALLMAAGQKELGLPAVELLLHYNADVNVTNRASQTPLISATLAGQRAVAEALLAAGATVNSKDSQGKTALQYAGERGNKDLVELLQQHGAKE